MDAENIKQKEAAQKLGISESRISEPVSYTHLDVYKRQGHVNPKEKVHMLLVDRQKKILYSLENTPGLKTMSSVYSMDIPAGVTSYH